MMLILIASFYACKETAVESNSSKKEVINKSNFNAVKNELENAAMNLASNNAWITNDLKKNIVDSAIFVESVSTHKVNYNDCNFNVKIELLSSRPEILQALDGNTLTKYGVMIDPDKFSMSTINRGQFEPTNIYLNDGSTQLFMANAMEESTFDERKSYAEQFDYPIFIVTVQEITEAMNATNAGFNKTAGNWYLVLKGVGLKTKLDYSNDEFELYLNDGQGYSCNNEINNYTSYQFDGNSRKDKRNGPNVTFPDVNNAQYYACSQDIYLTYLPSTNSSCSTDLQVVGIEDDYQAEHVNRDAQNNAWTIISTYNASTNTKGDFNTHFYQQGYAWDEDDVYAAGVYKLTQTTVSDRMSGRTYFATDESSNGGLQGVNWVFGSAYY